MKTAGTKEGRTGKLHFHALPSFAEFILENHFRQFVLGQIRSMRRMNVPMLKYYRIESKTDEELADSSAAAYESYLRHVINNQLDEYITLSIEQWLKKDQPNFSRDQIVADDIILATYIRKQAFFGFIPVYTSDLTTALDLVRELEEYSLEAQSRSFNTYIALQNARMKKVNRSLERHRRQLLEAQEISKIGSFEWDMTGRKTSVFTPQVHKIFGLEDLNDASAFYVNIHPSDREKLKRAVKEAMDGSREFECEFRYKYDGHYKIIWTRGIAERKDGKPFRMRGTIMDISDRHEMIEQLKSNERLYKQAQKLAHIGNWTYELASEKITWSDELYRIFGLEPQSQEITLDMFINMMHPDDRPVMKRQFRQILRDLKADYRMRIVLPGNITKVILGKARILKDEMDRPHRLIGTCQDITNEVMLNEELKNRERNLAELNRSLEQKNLELQRSNDELTSFSYVASHDLQEPLRKMKTFSDLLLNKERERLSKEGQQWIDRITAAAVRMQMLIEDLLSFSHTQVAAGKKEDVDLNQVVSNIITFYGKSVEGSPLTITSERLPVITGVGFQMQQLFDNLLSNSIKYRKSEGPVVIKISVEFNIAVNHENVNATFMKISVADNGIGFEQRYASKIFEIFQRLHGQLNYSGTGIGLAICKKIAEYHGGFIRAYSEPMQGATFSLFLPMEIIVKEEKI